MKNTVFTVPKSRKQFYISDRISTLLNRSIQFYHATYIQGITGTGKTSYMLEWIHRQKKANDFHIYWLDCSKATDNLLSELKRVLTKEKTPVLLIIDHYEQIAYGPMDQSLLAAIKCLPNNSRRCFITQGRIPDYVVSDIATQRANVITGPDIMLNDQEIKEYINEYKGCDLNLGHMDKAFQLPAIPITLNLMVVEYEKHQNDFSSMMGNVEDQLLRYLSYNIIETWSEEEKELLGRIYPYDRVTRGVIISLYGNDAKYRVLEKFANRNCFLLRENGEEFIVASKIRVFLERVFSMLLTAKEYEKVNRDAIAYYISREEYEYVIWLSIRIGAYEEAIAAIVKYHSRAKDKVLQNKYVEYLRMIPDEVVANNSDAICWLAINSLVCLDLDEFSKWYGIFINRYNNAQLTSEQWMKEDVTYAFLKLLSPYTTVQEYLRIIEKGYGRYSLDGITRELFQYKEMDMLTYLLLKRWNLEDGIEVFMDNEKAEQFLGTRLYSLLMVYLGSCYCEAQQMEKAQSCLFKGTEKCSQIGMYGPGLVGELHLLDTQRNQNLNKYDILGKKEAVIKSAMEKEEYLRRFDTFFIRIWLQRHNLDKINGWIADLHKDSCITHTLLNIRNFVQQVRVLILIEDLYNAQVELESLLQIYESFHFEIDKLEAYALYAIICYRRNMVDRSVQFFLKAYWMSKKQHLLSIIINEGVAIQPILEAVVKRLPAVAYENEFQQIQAGVNIRAKYYPKYLMPKAKQKEVLTKTEVEILIELDSGNTLSQIAQKRCISLNTVKQHTKSIYMKLKVNKRNMALRVAKERGLI